ncbi:MAG: hypothetical protein IAF38_08490, partial [Bacteroidia bacterium]|nr:hypothetical protein [Bacteroidia bacterium]
IIKGFAEGLRAVGKVKSPVYFVFLTGMIWVCYYAMFHVCFNCLAGTSSLGFSEGITGFVFGTFTVMLTPGGIGAYPLAMREILNKVYFLPVTLGFSLGWLSWIASFISVVTVALFALLFLPIYNKNKNDPTP